MVKRRAMKFLVRVGIVIGIGIVVILIAIAVLDYRAGRQLAAELQRLREAGEPVRLADLEREAPPAESDAALELAHIATQLDALERSTVPVHDESQREKYYDGQQLSAEGYRLLSDAFQQHPDVVPALERVANAATYTSQLDLSQPPTDIVAQQIERVTVLRRAARVLTSHAECQLYEKQLDDALRTAMMILRIARHADEEPFLVSYLVALAVRATGLRTIEQVLAAGPVSSEVRSELANELARQDGMTGFVEAMRSERVLGIAHFHQTFPSVLRKRWWIRRDELNLLRQMARRIDRGAQPHYAVAKKLRQLNEEHSSRSPMTRLITPALTAARTAMDRTRATLRCAAVVNALQAVPTLPDDPGAMLEATGLASELTTDPFTGHPLKITPAGGGWILYSAGPDGQDDGGSINDEKDVGLGPLPLRFDMAPEEDQP